MENQVLKKCTPEILLIKIRQTSLRNPLEFPCNIKFTSFYRVLPCADQTKCLEIPRIYLENPRKN